MEKEILEKYKKFYKEVLNEIMIPVQVELFNDSIKIHFSEDFLRIDSFIEPKRIPFFSAQYENFQKFSKTKLLEKYDNTELNFQKGNPYVNIVFNYLKLIYFVKKNSTCIEKPFINLSLFVGSDFDSLICYIGDIECTCYENHGMNFFQSNIDKQQQIELKNIKTYFKEFLETLPLNGLNNSDYVEIGDDVIYPYLNIRTIESDSIIGGVHYFTAEN